MNSKYLGRYCPILSARDKSGLAECIGRICALYHFCGQYSRWVRDGDFPEWTGEDQKKDGAE